MINPKGKTPYTGGVWLGDGSRLDLSAQVRAGIGWPEVLR
jgi:hypothetical protein